MGDFDLFHFYRFLLAVVVCAYCAVHFVLLIWRWSGLLSDKSSGGLLIRRYVVLLLLRMRFRRFVAEFVTLGGLLFLLILLIRRH